MFQIGYDAKWWPLVDAGQFRRDFPEIDIHGANTITVRSGVTPSTGTVLMTEADYRSMMEFLAPDQTAETEGYYPYAPYSDRLFTIKLTATDSFAGWNVLGACRLHQTAKADGSTVVIVELADPRRMYGRYKLYYGENVYGPGLDVLTTLSQDWNTLIAARWNAAKTIGGNPGLNLSTWANLASVPTEVPAGFDFRRNPVTVVEQIETLLNRCGYTLSHRSDGLLYAAQIGAGTLPTYPAAALWMSYQPSDNQYNNRPGGYSFVVPQLSDGQYVTVPSTINAGADIDGLGVKTVEYEYGASASSFAKSVQDAWERRSHRRDDVYYGFVSASPVGSWHTSVSYWNQGFGLYTRIQSEPVPLMRAAMQFDGIPWSNTESGGHVFRVTTGTPTAGSYTLTFTKPDASSVTTAAIAYSTGGAIVTTAQAEIDAVLGSGVATVSGSSYTVGGVIVTWIIPGYAMTSANIGSFTGASAYSITTTTGTLRTTQKPTGIIVDNSTGVGIELYQSSGVCPSSKIKGYSASYYQTGMVSSAAGGAGQTLGRGPKYLPALVVIGRAAPGDDPVAAETYAGSRKTYLAAGETIDLIFGQEYGADVMTIELEDAGTPFGPFGGAARFVGVNDGVSDGSYWEWRAGEDPELGYTSGADPIMRFASAEEDRGDGDGFVRGGYVEINGGNNTRFRVSRDAAGLTTYFRGIGVYDGIDADVAVGGSTLQFTGGILTGIV